MRIFLCIITILFSIIFIGINALKLDGACAFALGSEKGLQKLEYAVSEIQSFHKENGRYPTNVEINCTNYKAIEVKKEICIQTIFLQAIEDTDHFVVTYKSVGVPFSGTMGAGLKREFIYETKTQSFNYAHLDTVNEVVFSRIMKIILGLLLVLLPLMYLRASRHKGWT